MKAEQPIAGYSGNPQVEEGFTKISNELLEALYRHNFTSRQFKVVFAIIRMTYGFNKKSDALSGWQISKITNLSQQNVSKTIRELIELKILFKHETGRYAHGVFVGELSLNKLYDTWLTINKTDRKQNDHQHIDHQQVVSSTINDLLNNHQQNDVHIKKSKEIPKESIYLPEFIPLELWNEFILMRKRIKKPMTAYAEKLMIKKITKSHANKFDVVKMIEKSIINSWQDIYEPDKNKGDAEVEKMKGEML